MIELNSVNWRASLSCWRAAGQGCCQKVSFCLDVENKDECVP